MGSEGVPCVPDTDPDGASLGKAEGETGAPAVAAKTKPMVQIADRLCFPFKRLVLMEKAAERMSVDYVANLDGPTLDALNHDMIDSGQSSARSLSTGTASPTVEEQQSKLISMLSKRSFARWKPKRGYRDTSRWDLFPGINDSAFMLSNKAASKANDFRDPSPSPLPAAGERQRKSSYSGQLRPHRQDALAKTFHLDDIQAAEGTDSGDTGDPAVGTSQLTTCESSEASFEEDSESQDPAKELSDVRDTCMLHVLNHKGLVFVNEYALITTLGRGSFGEVKMALNTKNLEVYALKLIAKTRRRQSRRHSGSNIAEAAVLSEINVMKKLSHPNLVRLVEVIDDPANFKILMVLEYVGGGSLFGGMKLTSKTRFLGIEARKYLRDILQGLSYLHGHRIAHGDLKPDNFLLGLDGHVKIADFGSSQLTRISDLVDRTAGTPAFMAPEVCGGEPYHARQADLWALGASLYMLIFGTLPFKSSSILGLYKEICESPLQFPSEMFVSDSLKHLLAGLLEKDPGQRMSLLSAMSHPWVTHNGENPLLPFDMEEQLQPVEEEEGVLLESWPDDGEGGVLASALRALLPATEPILYPDGSLLMKPNEQYLGVFKIDEGLVEIESFQELGDVRDEDEEEDVGDSKEPTDVSMLEIMLAACNKASELVSASREVVDTQVKLTSERGPGSYFADLGTLEKGQKDPSTSYTVRAKGDVIARYVSFEKFYEFVAKRPEIEADGRAVLAQRTGELLVASMLEVLASFRTELQSEVASLGNLISCSE